MNIHITSGDILNGILQKKYLDEMFIPFREAMLQGDYQAKPFTDDFIAERCKTHHVSREDYLNKLNCFIDLLSHVNDYDVITLWFGEEPFCNENRKFVINVIRESGFKGTLISNIVDENTGEILSSHPVQSTAPIWENLYRAAKAVLNPRAVSEMMEAGGVAAAIEAGSGRIYVGVCVDGACTLGICAERNAIFNMITNGENVIRKVVAVNWDGKVLAPCGACRELMAQFMPKEYRSIEVMLDYESGRIVSLGELTPEWWI